MSDLFELFCIQCLYGCCCAVICASVIEPERTYQEQQSKAQQPKAQQSKAQVHLSPLSTIPPSVETHIMKRSSKPL